MTDFYAPIRDLDPADYDSGTVIGEHYGRAAFKAGSDGTHFYDPDRSEAKDGFDDGWTAGYWLQARGNIGSPVWCENPAHGPGVHQAVCTRRYRDADSAATDREECHYPHDVGPAASPEIIDTGGAAVPARFWYVYGGD